MRVDFGKVSVQATIEGEPIEMDMRKELGNLIWGAARDIAVSDFGKEVYWSEGPVEVRPQTAGEILSVLDMSSATAPVKRALRESLTPKNEGDGSDNDN